MLNNQPNQPQRLLTAEEIEVRIWAFVVVTVTLILAGIVFFMLYSVTFVAQPIKSMAPIDTAYTKMLNDIVLLIVGGIGGVMSKKGVSSLAESMATRQQQDNDTIIVAPSAPVVAQQKASAGTWSPPVGSPMPQWINPPLDEEWRAPPPPTTPPEYMHPEREEIAKERAAAEST